MISKLAINDPTQTPVKWLSTVAAFKAPCVFEFKPGLNILWGRNGAGKTSLTKVLARLFHCEQGNQPIVTEDSLRQLVGDALKDADLRNGVEVEHDGQGVRHFDPSHAPGLLGGGAAFDWDFGMAGIANTMFKGSAGQTTMFRFDRLLQEIIAGVVPDVKWKARKDYSHDPWKSRAELANFFLLGTTTESGPPTILLDEPERSYDLNTQISIWQILRAYADEVQFIISSHSLFALNIPEAHYIELSPGYKLIADQALALLPTWATNKRPKVPKAETAKIRAALAKQQKQEG